MAYMHKRNIIHCDLKPSKLLFVRNLQTLKIFYLDYLSENKSLSTAVQYVDPEVCIFELSCVQRN